MLDVVRSTVRSRADELRLPQELLLAPDSQRRLAWDLGEEIEAGRTSSASTQEIGDRLTAMGARPWQVEQAAPSIAAALVD